MNLLVYFHECFAQKEKRGNVVQEDRSMQKTITKSPTENLLCHVSLIFLQLI